MLKDSSLLSSLLQIGNQCRLHLLLVILFRQAVDGSEANMKHSRKSLLTKSVATSKLRSKKIQIPDDIGDIFGFAKVYVIDGQPTFRFHIFHKLSDILHMSLGKVPDELLISFVLASDTTAQVHVTRFVGIRLSTR